MRRIVVIFLTIVSVLIHLSCSSAGLKKESPVYGKTKEMLDNYRGKTGLKLAVLKADDIDRNSEPVPAEKMNEVFQAVFDDGRFVIVERELLKKVLDELSLQQSGIVSADRINEIGKLSGAQLVLAVRQNSSLIDLRIISVDTGEILGFISFPLDGTRAAPASNYEKLKQRFLDMECPNQTRQNKDVIVASFNSYTEDQKELYMLSMIESCKRAADDARKSEENRIKAKELNLDKKQLNELEKMFIERDSKQYASKATRKLIVSQYRKAYLTDAPKQNPSMKGYYRDLYREELVKLMLAE